MKKVLILFCLFLFTQNSYAQKNVYLKINHLLGSSSFAFNQVANNDLGTDFQVTRLEYYISNIVLYHDGTQTAVTNTFILAGGAAPVNELLGAYNITTLDSIAFGIGIGPNENHLDPSSYASSHPLGLKSPSMHWGWTAGYRFIAFEGITGASFSDLFEMHSLGDANYMIKTIITAGNLNGNTLEIPIDADYTQALRGVNLNGGIISHGENGAAKTVIDNFNAHVFSAGATSVPVIKIQDISIDIYPNPIATNSSLFINYDHIQDMDIQVYDMMGKLHKNFAFNSNTRTITFSNTGMYVLNVLKNGQILFTQKIHVHE